MQRVGWWWNERERGRCQSEFWANTFGSCVNGMHPSQFTRQTLGYGDALEKHRENIMDNMQKGIKSSLYQSASFTYLEGLADKHFEGLVDINLDGLIWSPLAQVLPWFPPKATALGLKFPAPPFIRDALIGIWPGGATDITGWNAPFGAEERKIPLAPGSRFAGRRAEVALKCGEDSASARTNSSTHVQQQAM